jgi:hypothetical protein
VGQLQRGALPGSKDVLFVKQQAVTIYMPKELDEKSFIEKFAICVYYAF